MKRTMITALLAIACFATQAAAVWSIDLTNAYGSDPAFSLVGTFTTASADIDRGAGEQVLSFAGTINGAPSQLVALGTDPAFDYDNLFFGPTDLAAAWSTLDAFDSAGLVLTAPGDSFNLYSSGVLVGLLASGASEALAGTITFAGLTTSVPEPSALWLCVLSFVCCAARPRRTAGSRAAVIDGFGR